MRREINTICTSQTTSSSIQDASNSEKCFDKNLITVSNVFLKTFISYLFLSFLISLIEAKFNFIFC